MSNARFRALFLDADATIQLDDPPRPILAYTPDRWPKKAEALWAAWKIVFSGPPPNPNALRLVLAQAEHETHCGDDWDRSGNWGACDLRALSAAEQTDFANGLLKIGYWLYPDKTYGAEHRPNSVGIIQGDSDPNTGKFRVWFAAFPTDTLGAAYMLRAGVGAAARVLDDPTCSSFAYAKALYVVKCYFGGFSPGARPCGHRPDPLNLAEISNINAYSGSMMRVLPSINAALANWTPPERYGQEYSDPFTENVSPNAGGDTAPATNVGDDEK